MTDNSFGVKISIPIHSNKSEKSRVIMRKCIVGDYCNIEYEARPSDRKSDISIQNCIIMR